MKGALSIVTVSMLLLNACVLSPTKAQIQALEVAKAEEQLQQIADAKEARQAMCDKADVLYSNLTLPVKEQNYSLHIGERCDG